MALLGNVIWFILGGWLLGLIYLLGAVILFPLLPFLLPFIGYVFWPFGRAHVRKGDIAKWKRARGEEPETDGIESAGSVVKILANVVWVITFGWILALSHIFSSLANLASCILLITIPICLPNALANFKLVPVAFAPFGVNIVPKHLAEEIRKSAAASSL